MFIYRKKMHHKISPINPSISALHHVQHFINYSTFLNHRKIFEKTKNDRNRNLNRKCKRVVKAKQVFGHWTCQQDPPALQRPRRGGARPPRGRHRPPPATRLPPTDAPGLADPAGSSTRSSRNVEMTLLLTTGSSLLCFFSPSRFTSKSNILRRDDPLLPTWHIREMVCRFATAAVFKRSGKNLISSMLPSPVQRSAKNLPLCTISSRNYMNPVHNSLATNKYSYLRKHPLRQC